MTTFNTNQPQWYRSLPPHLRPPETKWRELELLKNHFGLNDELFIMALSSSKWAIVQTQVDALKNYRRQAGNVSEKELWRFVVWSRLKIKLTIPSPYDPPAHEIQACMDSVDSIVEKLMTWEKVMQFITDLDQPYFNDDPSGIKMKLDQIMESD